MENKNSFFSIKVSISNIFNIDISIESLENLIDFVLSSINVKSNIYKF